MSTYFKNISSVGPLTPNQCIGQGPQHTFSPSPTPKIIESFYALLIFVIDDCQRTKSCYLSSGYINNLGECLKCYFRSVGGSNHSPLALGASVIPMRPPSSFKMFFDFYLDLLFFKNSDRLMLYLIFTKCVHSIYK